MFVSAGLNMSEPDITLFWPLYAFQWVVIVLLGLLVLAAFHEIGRLEGVIGAIRGEVASLRPAGTGLQRGDQLPIDLGIALATRAFVVLLSYGCSGCIDLCRKLQGVDLGEWALVTIVHGRPPPPPADLSRAPGVDPAHLAELLSDKLPLPTNAIAVYDPERAWMRRLGVTAIPVALAFVGGRLVDQQVGPDIAWFTELPGKRRTRGKEVLSRPQDRAMNARLEVGCSG
jgi:hypothetical protein